MTNHQTGIHLINRALNILDTEGYEGTILINTYQDSITAALTKGGSKNVTTQKIIRKSHLNEMEIRTPNANDMTVPRW